MKRPFESRHEAGAWCAKEHKRNAQVMPLNDVATPDVALSAKPEECGNCQADDSVYWNPTGGWSCSSCGASDYEEAAE